MRPLRIARPNKYGAKKTEYRGETYDSKLEANHAAKLETLRLAGVIARWERPKTIALEVNGKIVCGYRPDFLITNPDGSQEYHECKGRMAAHSRIKIALFCALYPGAVLKVVK